MTSGRLVLVLHAHLPFVRHPEQEGFLEEDWLYEAITETYIPLAQVLDRLLRDGVRFRLTMTLSPPLCEMLADPLLRERYRRHAGRLLDSVRSERGRADERFGAALGMYSRLFTESLEFVCTRDLLAEFRRFQEAGALEILTSAATHGFLPFVRTPEPQIRAAVANYRKHFGRAPRGIWIPECAYAPGLDGVLAEHGLGFFFTDAHAVLNGSSVPASGVYAPVRTPAGVAAFARDDETSRQVWSAREGYPGDPAYREFYRDLGWDRGLERNLGIKTHRVTGDVPLDRKEAYDPGAAIVKAKEHAWDFRFRREAQARHLRDRLGASPVIVAPYDAELFGHWWFEGPAFLEEVFRALATSDVSTAAPPDVLGSTVPLQPLEPSASSWGDKGYYEVWLNGSNDWIYRHLWIAEERMEDLARREAGSDLERRALNQAAREVLLAESSDWAFMMTAGRVLPYAHRRFKEHVTRFTRLWEMVRAGSVEDGYLSDCEGKDSIFPEMDYRVFRP